MIPELIKRPPKILTPIQLAALLGTITLLGLIYVHPEWDTKTKAVILLFNSLMVILSSLIGTLSKLNNAGAKHARNLLFWIALLHVAFIAWLAHAVLEDRSHRMLANSKVAISGISNGIDQTQYNIGGILSDIPSNAQAPENVSADSTTFQEPISMLRAENTVAERTFTAQIDLQRIWVVPRSVRRNVREIEKTSHPEGVVDHYGWDGKERLPDCPASTPWVVDSYTLDRNPSSHRWYIDSPWKVIGIRTNGPLLYSTNMSAATPVYGMVVAGTLYSPLNSDKYTVVLCDLFLRDPSDRSLEALTSTQMESMTNIQDRMHLQLMIRFVIRSSEYQGLTNNSPKEWVIDYANHITP